MKPQQTFPCTQQNPATCLPLFWQLAEEGWSVVIKLCLFPRSGRSCIFAVTAVNKTSSHKCGRVSRKTGPREAGTTDDDSSIRSGTVKSYTTPASLPVWPSIQYYQIRWQPKPKGSPASKSERDTGPSQKARLWRASRPCYRTLATFTGHSQALNVLLIEMEKPCICFFALFFFSHGQVTH